MTNDDARRCALDAATCSDDGGVMFLGDLARELREERGTSAVLRMTGETLERVFFARLARDDGGGGGANAGFDERAEPYAWTVETYRRATEEHRRLGTKSDGASTAAREELQSCMEFCASYGGLLLNPALAGTFPQSEWAAGRGACQLLDAMRTVGGIPHGYLERLATRCEDEGLDEIAERVFDELRV